MLKAHGGSWRALAARLRNRSSSAGRREPDAFRRAERGTFFQSMPHLRNPFIEDAFLRSYLARAMPAEVASEVFADLERFGARLCSEVDALGREAELNPPRLTHFNACGHRVDELLTSAAWQRMHAISAEEGLIAIAFERKHREWSRLHQFAKLLLYAPSSGLYSCPLAMTDGAAKLIESTEACPPWLKERAFPRLTSRDPTHFWTSGQWMTERQGGSDVADGTETSAVRQPDGSFRLHGYKWFTSATDANMAFTLARVVGEDGKVGEGTQGLSLFYLELKDQHDKYNNLEIQRLKNKLGTRQLPTAELLLDGTVAHIVGEEGRGVAGISSMLTITRLHNSVSAVGGMRRMVHLSRDYATSRRAFGRFLADHPLHVRTLSLLEEEVRAAMLLTLELSRLLGRMEVGVASSRESLCLRILTPITKLYTAKQAIAVASEGLESFGGQGYIEDTGLPTIFRDAQVLPIWEGTTNILSLDVLRVLSKVGPEALSSLADDIRSRLSPRPPALEGATEQVLSQLAAITEFGSRAMQEDPATLELAARDFALSIGQLYAGALLVEHGSGKMAGPSDQMVARRWCSRPLPLRPLDSYSREESSADLLLLMDGHRLGDRAL